MKKLFITIFLVAISVAMFAQNGMSLFKPVPKNLFTVVNKNLKAKNVSATTTNTVFLWRLSAMLTATELTWDKTAQQFTSSALSSVGPAIGLRHYTQLSDGTAYNNYGFNLGVLLGDDVFMAIPSNVKIAATVNAFNFFNFGGAYTINANNPWSILVGAVYTF